MTYRCVACFAGTAGTTVQCGAEATEFFLPDDGGTRMWERCYCAEHEKLLDDFGFTGLRRSSLEEFIVREVLGS